MSIAEQLQEILERVAQGETTVADAAALREVLAMQAMQQTVGAASEEPVQAAVGAWLREHGQHDGWNDGEFAARMLAWAQVELADLTQLFDLPKDVAAALFGPGMYTMPGAVELAAALATNLLLRVELWDGCGPDLEAAPRLFEQRLVEVLVPLLALADVMQVDVLGAVRTGVTAESVEMGGGA
jgi:hypothetical protein